MPAGISLDELITKKAAEFADQIKAAAAMADKEEEIRIEVERQLAFIERDAGIRLEGRHEFTLATGRPDSVYDRVIIEYKNPKSASARIGPRADSPGTKKVVEQIKGRFYDMRSEHGQPLNSLFGVGLDGNHFVFVRFRDNKWQVQDPVEVTKHSAERFLWALFNLGTKGKAFTPEYLAGDFGSVAGRSIAAAGIKTLYDVITTTDHPKAQTFFNQWKILFGEVCGYDVDNPSDKIRKLADFYDVPRRGVKAADLLFSVHTYYALFMKLLASEIVTFFHRLPTPLESMLHAPTSASLKREMERLEDGSIFRHLNITNFLEGDLFSWYPSVWCDSIEELVRKMVDRLDEYNPGTLSEDPASSRDLLKKLYQQLFPKSVRHDLGEYYTPDWLAEHVLNELGYVGDPDKRLLDPACGSGTFLVMAINRVRRWYDEHREERQFGEDDLCRKILSNVVGFDLNPLAVMAARTNYLIAVRQLINRVGSVEIPVYLCDSILTPSEYGEAHQREMFGKPMQLRTSAKPTPFHVPREVTTDGTVLARYTGLLERLSPERSGHSADEFIERCKDEGIPVSEVHDHRQLFVDLRVLDKAGKNSVWARIIKNAFAPLFVGRVDFVAGNPPWVRWGYLPKEYREASMKLWKDYGLFSLKGFEATLGAGEKDLSQLFVYCCIDNYLSDGGRLGFLITQTVFKAKGQAEGFRRFKLGMDGAPFKVISANDLSKLQPFEGASNLTASFVAEKGSTTEYPVPYTVWFPKSGAQRVQSDMPIDEVEALCERVTLQARPVDPAKLNSQWQTSSPSATSALDRVAGPSAYKAKIGARTDPYGVYQVRVLRRISEELVLIENCADAGKTKVDLVQYQAETSLLYPLIRGRDVRSWVAGHEVYVLMVQDPETRLAIPETTLKMRCPKAHEYLRHFEPTLRKRGSRAVQAVMEASAFYAMFAVGVETFAPFKVVWNRMGSVLRAALVSSIDDPLLGKKLIIPSDTVTFVGFDSEDEGYFFLGLVNSSPARAAIYSFSSSGRGLGAPAILKQLKIERFSKTKELHSDIVRIAKGISRLVQSSHPDFTRLKSDIDRLDILAADYWGLSPEQVSSCNESIQTTEKKRLGKRFSEISDQDLLEGMIDVLSETEEE